jgi:site-specific DNA-cytosine methylase
MDGGAVTGRTYTALFPFCGIGAGALGFREARAKLFGSEARFKILGGIDLDALACEGFRYLTGAPALVADIATLTPEALRAFAGEKSPDVVFLSPPCKSFSQLTSKKARRLRKYRLMNLLALQWIKLMLAAWRDRPPRLVLLENVPGIATLGSALLRKIRSLLRAAGFVVSPGETHDCGEIANPPLAQRRKRYLLVARHQGSVPVLLYQPPRRKVRACGEVLGTLPLPGDPSAGPLHELPRISQLNWWRLSMIPAGGDWQDLPGMPERKPVKRGRAKGAAPAAPTKCDGRRFNNVFCVTPWDAATGAVNAGAGPSSGGWSVADVRVRTAFRESYGVLGWGDASGTVKGDAWVTTGRYSVADPRLNISAGAFRNLWRVCDWSEPLVTVTGATRPGGGAPSVADVRVPTRYAMNMRVAAWGDPAWCVTGCTDVQAGAPSVADPRSMQIDNGPAAVADPRVDVDAEGGGLAVTWYARTLRDRPGFALFLPTADGTWHRPLTTLELAVLQGLPAVVDGKPLALRGSAAKVREHIGNAVPVGAAQAVATEMLKTLVGAELETFALSSGGAVWVREREAAGQWGTA